MLHGSLALMARSDGSNPEARTETKNKSEVNCLLPHVLPRAEGKCTVQLVVGKAAVLTAAALA
jgi:hypothetical protein